MEARYTTNEILKMMENTDLGVTKDGNFLNGTLLTFIDGASQAMYNILHKPEAVAYSTLHRHKLPDDVWEQGYYALFNLYVESKPD